MSTTAEAMLRKPAVPRTRVYVDGSCSATSETAVPRVLLLGLDGRLAIHDVPQRRGVLQFTITTMH